MLTEKTRVYLRKLSIFISNFPHSPFGFVTDPLSCNYNSYLKCCTVVKVFTFSKLGTLSKIK